MKAIVLLIAILGSIAHAQDLNTKPFPDSFLFGVATAAYQIEGAWNESDKGESIWDYLTHTNPELVVSRDNGDVACDSYHRIDDDVEMLKNLGVNFYRFSISWPRLLPHGFSNKLSAKGLRYYHDVIDTLIENDITPVVTLYHWDLPNDIQKMGGWANPSTATYFTDYAEIVFQVFGDKVKRWITFNEPSEFCNGYGESNYAPVGLKLPGIGEYLCAYTVLKAHAEVYHLYEEKFRSRQRGEIGITLAVTWYQANSTDPDDIEAMERGLDWNVGLYAHPIFSEAGDYPEELRLAIERRSLQEGYAEPRLPKLTSEEIGYIRGTADFLGLNQYTTLMVSADDEAPIGTPSIEKDAAIKTWHDPSWNGSASEWLKVTPDGMRNVLVWLHQRYDAPILITENGFSDKGELDDDDRISYLQQYLSAVRDAMDRGVEVIGYTVWSLMDNFEWLDGYGPRFGLYHVNFSDPELPRTIKKSGEYYKQVIQTRVVLPGTMSETDVDTIVEEL